MNKWDISGSNLTKKQKQELNQEIHCRGIDETTLVTGAKLYIVRNNLQHIPTCKSCDTELSFHTPSCSYRTYCSAKCSANSNNTINKRRSTNLEKYGTINVLTKDRNKRRDEQFEATYNNFERFNTKIAPKFDVTEFKGKSNKTEYNWICVRCNNDFTKTFLPHLQRWPKCPK
jgi:hypothetical protein